MKTPRFGTDLKGFVLGLSALMLLNSCVGFTLVSQRPAVRPPVDAVAAASEEGYEISDETPEPEVQPAAEQPTTDAPAADAVTAPSEY